MKKFRFEYNNSDINDNIASRYLTTEIIFSKNAMCKLLKDYPIRKGWWKYVRANYNTDDVDVFTDYADYKHIPYQKIIWQSSPDYPQHNHVVAKMFVNTH